MVRKVIAYFLLSVGILATLFFKGKGGDAIPYAAFFSGTALFVGMIGLIMLFTTPSLRKIRERKALNELIEYFKNGGERITINVSDCKILENNYSCEHESRPLFEDIAFSELESFVPDEENVIRDKTRNIKIDQVTQSILVYEQEFDGRKQRFVSHIIQKDKATLMFLFSQKQITLHYDKNNPSRCYFELDFPDW